MNINAKTEKELLKYRAAQAAYKRKVDTRWEQVGGRPKPPAKPLPITTTTTTTHYHYGHVGR